MSDLITTPELKRVTEPAKRRWRNKWLTHSAPHDIDTGERLGSGPGIYDSPRTFASKADAEKNAERVIAYNSRRGKEAPFYLGAFPEGERP